MTVEGVCIETKENLFEILSVAIVGHKEYRLIVYMPLEHFTWQAGSMAGIL